MVGNQFIHNTLLVLGISPYHPSISRTPLLAPKPQHSGQKHSWARNRKKALCRWVSTGERRVGIRRNTSPPFLSFGYSCSPTRSGG